jgi:hypothetical protein
MIDYPAGGTATLLVQWLQYAGGPPAPVSSVQVKIVAASDGTVVVPLGSTGVQLIATGIYEYQWNIPAGTPLGDYVVFWQAVDASSDLVIAVTTADNSSSTGSSPCEAWPAIWTCPLDAGLAAVTGSALQAATEMLWAASGRQFGLCQVTLRPCRSDCANGGWMYPGGSGWFNGTWPPVLTRTNSWSWSWFGLTCGTCVSECSCASVSQFKLPGPVAEIVSIFIDGAQLPASAYRLDNSRLVVRVDGDVWPLCNNLSLNTDQVGTWSVTALFGQEVPLSGQLAVGELACEIAKAMAGRDCGLSQPVQSIARQGVNMTFLDPHEAVDQGKMGLRFTDMFLSTYNPGGLRAPSRVYNVDDPGPRRVG